MAGLFGGHIDAFLLRRLAASACAVRSRDRAHRRARHRPGRGQRDGGTRGRLRPRRRPGRPGAGRCGRVAARSRRTCGRPALRRCSAQGEKAARWAASASAVTVENLARSSAREERCDPPCSAYHGQQPIAPTAYALIEPGHALPAPVAVQGSDVAAGNASGQYLRPAAGSSAKPLQGAPFAARRDAGAGRSCRSGDAPGSEAPRPKGKGRRRRPLGGGTVGISGWSGETAGSSRGRSCPRSPRRGTGRTRARGSGARSGRTAWRAGWSRSCRCRTTSCQ